jgi:hypothetical protein
MTTVKCRRCGESDQLYPDPAGYCNDAQIPEPHPQAGAPLLCIWCSDSKHPSIVALREEKLNRQMCI